MSDPVGLLPWFWTAMAIALTAGSHILFKLYSMTRRLEYAVATGTGLVMVPVFSFLALKELTVAQVYLCAALVPVFTTTGAHFFIKETIGWRHWVGLSMVLSGVVIYQLN